MLKNVWLEMDGQLSNYARGKAIEIVIVGLAAAILFLYFGLEYVALLSVLVGFSVLIPFLGALIVTIPVAVIGLLQFNFTFDFWLLMGSYVALQILDGNLLVPILFSDAVKLHPVMIILAVFVFGSLFGFWGVFFAIPIATLIKAIWNAWPKKLSE
jgi:putative permease